MRQVRVGTALQPVVDLREPPHVVIGEVAEAPVPDPHLVVHDAAVDVDHLQQPPQAELRLGAEVRAAVREQARVVAERELHGHLDERGRVHELDVVAGVEPPALDVDRAGRHQGLRQMSVHVDGGLVRGRVRVVQVRGLAVQQPRDDVAAVVLLLEERQRVGQEVVEDRGSAADLERRRRGARGLEHVDTRVGERVEVDLVHVSVAIVPHASVRADRSGEGHDAGRLRPGRTARLRDPGWRGGMPASDRPARSRPG